MEIWGKITAQGAFFPGRIYSIFPAVVFWCLGLNYSFCQEIGAYRTIASGNFDNIAIWEVFDGVFWTAASAKPNLLNDIYIDQTRKVTLTGNEAVKSLFINAETGAGEKLNLNGFNLDVYGSLRAFSGAAPGMPSGSWNSQNWIGNSVTSTITFKGNSRTIIPKNAWSGFTTQSRYSVIFEPEVGHTLTIEEPLKAVRFTIRSGTLLQKADVSVTPSFCASLTFNTETTFYPSGSFGDFIIESNGTLSSECNQNILARSISGSVSANLFDLQAGGELILLGTSPQIETANLQLNGKVSFRKNSGIQNFITKSYPGSEIPLTFHDLEIQGTQNVTLPSILSVSGNILQTGSGQFQSQNTHLTLLGHGDQLISGFSLNTQDLTVDKSGGEALLAHNLIVLRDLTMLDGKLNFQDNTLTLNTSSVGTLSYQGGSWEKLTSFTYANAPTTFNASNATFPFGDRYHGGIRKVQLSGTHAGGDLTIDYTEFYGADYSPNFNDLDGTPILYRLYSHFNFSGLSPSSNPLELRISADKLIVDEPEDLRLVCTGYAAPGMHVESSDQDNLWAIRNMAFGDLPGNNFTVGSFRALSILPLTWLSISATNHNNLKQISWSLASEKDIENFEIHRSEDMAKTWDKIGQTVSQGTSEVPTSYTFIDDNHLLPKSVYYRIKALDHMGKWSWSKVVRLAGEPMPHTPIPTIFPNPHSLGKVQLQISNDFNLEDVQISIHTIHGALISSFGYTESIFSEKLEFLPSGVYLINISDSEVSLQNRWIKH
ncbi:T9SS type A sorting domain-containing protein [Algoriphagus sp. AGSA1]|uniref:T9SS type A sorting domain-containing protein n=1 Tax=Algoriphagus sp. AGSA1 TaxID=2907213 RepID=UPI001F482842|nr:T9SS type A sorting domain-containing protein [Algoriphagus sp. AGSA1]MCE7057267.1 T9SS type A sorting domain-containing protein [Algoriphagus sp. AGSA1]